jgi:hypothetical protein
MKLFWLLSSLLISFLVFCTQDKMPNTTDLEQLNPLNHRPEMKMSYTGEVFDVAVADTLTIKLAATHPPQFKGSVGYFHLQYSADGKKTWDKIVPATANPDKSYGAVFTDVWPTTTKDTTFSLWIRAKDNDSTFSDSISVSVRVHQYCPVVTAVKSDSTVPIRRPLEMKCSAYDSLSAINIGGRPVKYIWSVNPPKPVFGINQTKITDTTTDTLISAFFKDTGKYTISVSAIDKYNLRSADKFCNVRVNEFLPKLSFKLPVLYFSANDLDSLPLPSVDSVISTGPAPVAVLTYKLQFSWDVHILDTVAFPQGLLNHKDNLLLSAVKWENKKLRIQAPLASNAWYCVSAMDADSLWSNTDTVWVNGRIVRPFIRDTVRLQAIENTFIGDSIRFYVTASDSIRKQITSIHWRWKKCDPQTSLWTQSDTLCTTPMLSDKNLNFIKIDTSYSPFIKLGLKFVPYDVKAWAENSSGVISDTVTFTTIPLLGKPVLKIDSAITVQVFEADTFRVASLYDPDTAGLGNPVVFHWKFTDSLNEEKAQTPILVTTFKDSSIRTLTVYCVDRKGVPSDPDTIIITVSKGIPSANLIGMGSSDSITANAGDSITLQFGGTDPTGQPLNYEWTITNNPKVSDTLSSVRVLPGLLQKTSRKFWVGNAVGSYNWTYTVTDLDGFSDKKTVKVIVKNPPMVWDDPFSGVWDFGAWQ